MLEVAIRLLKQGNRAESERVKSEARIQRTISTMLMAEANNLELNSETYQYSGNSRSGGQSRPHTNRVLPKN
jgi:hypothetical protein